MVESSNSEEEKILMDAIVSWNLKKGHRFQRLQEEDKPEALEDLTSVISWDEQGLLQL